MVNSESMSPSQAAGTPRSRRAREPQAREPAGQPPHAGSDRQSVRPLLFHQAVQGDADTGGFLDVFFVGSMISLALGPCLDFRADRVVVHRTEHLVEIRLLAEHARRCPADLDFFRRASRLRAAGRREQEDFRLPHHRDHAEQAQGALHFAEVAAGQERDAVALAPPPRRIHPVMTARRQREHRHWTFRLEDRGHDARQGEVLHVDGQDRRLRPRFFQQHRCLLGAGRVPDDELDVSQLLFRFGKPSLHRLDLFNISAPITIFRLGGAREYNTNPRFAPRFGGRRLGCPRLRPGRASKQQSAHGARPQELPSRAVLTHCQIPFLNVTANYR